MWSDGVSSCLRAIPTLIPCTATPLLRTIPIIISTVVMLIVINGWLISIFKEGGFGAECFTVEHDELIAHSLQEELSQLAVRDWHGAEECQMEEGEECGG